MGRAARLYLRLPRATTPTYYHHTAHTCAGTASRAGCAHAAWWRRESKLPVSRSCLLRTPWRHALRAPPDLWDDAQQTASALCVDINKQSRAKQFVRLAYYTGRDAALLFQPLALPVRAGSGGDSGEHAALRHTLRTHTV